MAYRKQSGPITTLIFGVIFIVAGFFLVKHGAKTIEKAKASLSWPSVQGTILKSDVVRKKNKDKKTMYSADVVFEYMVAGESYESNKVRVSTGTSSSSDSAKAHKITKKYRKGKSVSVYHDPDAPEYAVLEPGVFLESKILWYVGLAFLGVGVLCVGGLLIKILFIGGLLLGRK